MSFTFGKRSRKNLEHVHPDLILLAARALQLSSIDFGITEGCRTLERQQHLIDIGASSLKKPENSRHVPGKDGLAKAIDVVAYDDGEVSWAWPLYHQIYDAFCKASEELDIPFEWGGNWKSFKDGPHFQLPKKEYP